MNSNESLVVHICEGAHDELAIESVGNTTMSWNRIAEILDMERTLDSGCEETAEWGDERGECRKEEDVELERFNVDRCRHASPGGELNWEIVVVLDEDWVNFAVKASKEVCTEIIDRADEICVFGE